MPEGRGAEYGPKLRVEDVTVGKEIAYRAVAEEGIGLLRGNAPHELVAADVERANRYRAAAGKGRGEFRRIAVGDELLLLCRLHLTVEPEVFAAVKTYAAGSLLADPGERNAGVDVGVDRNIAAGLQSAGRRTASRFFGELKLAFDEVVELADRGLVGIERNGAISAVEQHDFARLHARGDVDKPCDGGNCKRPCKKRDMARRGAAVRGEAEHELARQLDRL